MTTPGPGSVYRVSVRATGPGPPAATRLRRFLKCALRAFGLRWVAVEVVDAPAPIPPSLSGRSADDGNVRPE